LLIKIGMMIPYEEIQKLSFGDLTERGLFGIGHKKPINKERKRKNNRKASIAPKNRSAIARSVPPSPNFCGGLADGLNPCDTKNNRPNNNKPSDIVSESEFVNPTNGYAGLGWFGNGTLLKLSLPLD